MSCARRYSVSLQTKSNVNRNYNLSAQRKEQALRFCRELDSGLQRYLRGDNAPLIVIGVDYLVALYRQANNYPHLLDSVSGNPDTMSPHELRAAAWELVEPQFRAPRERALEALPVYMRESRASTQLPEILPAAHAGRVVGDWRLETGDFAADCRSGRGWLDGAPASCRPQCRSRSFHTSPWSFCRRCPGAGDADAPTRGTQMVWIVGL